jgi:DegV family protein with EDD domain
VAFGAESFLDGQELSAGAFWERIGGTTVLPTTASPSPHALLSAYRDAARATADGVISVHLSGKLSRTADTARLAARDSPLPVEVVDTRSVCAGQALVVLAAARAASAGAPLEEVAGEARGAIARLVVAAVLDTVDFLKRGGRVGRGKAAMSELLRIRPILSIEDGEPVLVARTRTRSRAIEELLDRVCAPAEAAAVFHSHAPEAEDVASRVGERCGVGPAIGLIGAVTGTHLGPRAIGVSVLRQ